MVANYNSGLLGSASRTTTGVLIPSLIGGTGYIDTTNTDWLAFSLTIAGSGTVQVETSFNGGTTWDAVATIKGSDASLNPTANASGLWFGNSIGNLTRLNVTAVTGTVTLNGGLTDVTNAPNGVSGPNSAVSNSTVTPVAGSASVNGALAATTNATSVKASAGTLGEIDVFNGSAGTIYVKLYNKASAPTVGTDIPILTIPVAAAATFIQEFGQIGKRFTTGIAYAVTGAAADADTTAIALGAKIGLTYI